MPCSNANAKYSKLQELQCVGLNALNKNIYDVKYSYRELKI